MRAYDKKAWEAFRAQIIELDGGKCVRCTRRPSDGVVLQVHHKQYLPGRPLWDYPTGQCETLCSGCHAREHGIIRPSVGWECVGFHDLEDLIGHCELCGTSIRYIFMLQTPGWPSLEVGEICCDNLTSTKLASGHMESLRRFESRRRRFIRSRRWTLSPVGSPTLRQKGIKLTIVALDGAYRLTANGVTGRKVFASIVDTKREAFDQLESGRLRDFLARHGKLAA